MMTLRQGKTSGEWKGEAAYQRVFMFSTLYHFLYCILVSAALLSRPLTGGILFLLGRVIYISVIRFRPPRSEILSVRERKLGAVVLIVSFVLLLWMIMIFSESLPPKEFLTVFCLCLILTFRTGAAEASAEKSLIAGRSLRKSFSRVLLIQASFLVPVSVLLMIFIKTDMALPMIGAFLLGGIWEWSEIWRDRERLRTWSEKDRDEITQVRKAHAYRMFQNVFLAVTFAVQVTMPLVYAMIALRGSVLLYELLISSVVAVGAVYIVERVLRHHAREERDPSGIMLIGLVLWLYGLILFFRNFYQSNAAENYLSMGMCTAGCTLCIRTLEYLDSEMRKVASFALGRKEVPAYDWMLRSRIEMAVICGQTLSMVLFCLLEVFWQEGGGSLDAAELISLRPLMMLPAFDAVAAALVAVLRFPMTGGHIKKLDRYLKIRDEGKRNEALRAQLENVLLNRSFRHYGIRVLMFVLRPLYRHRVIGRENVVPDGDVSCVFVCNHGEIYGPVVTNLYVPFPFRPWVTSEMCDPAVVADYIYTNTFSKQEWMPRRLRRPFCTRLAGPFLAWVMRSVDSIPVYHGNPRQLMDTFRKTVDAMEAGDNILVFPENGGDGEGGRFVREGVGSFFTGFTTIGQLYHRRTGKNCLFIPIYADKHRRTVEFGRPLRYNGDASPADEKERVTALLRAEMLRMAGEEDDAAPEGGRS